MSRRVNRQSFRLYDPSAGAFSASTISGLVFWGKYNNVSLDGSSNVQTWTDISGSGHNLTQATALDRPPFSATGGPNGVGAISFNPTAQLTFLSASFTLVQPITFFIVYKQTSFHLQGTQDCILDGATLAQSLELFGSSNLGSGLYCGGAGSITTGTPEANNVYALTTCVANGASSVIRVNGSQVASGNPGTASPGGLVVGCRQDGAEPCTYLASELLVYNTSLSPSQIQQVEAYIRAEYNLW